MPVQRRNECVRDTLSTHHATVPHHERHALRPCWHHRICQRTIPPVCSRACRHGPGGCTGHRRRPAAGTCHCTGAGRRRLGHWRALPRIGRRGRADRCRHHRTGPACRRPAGRSGRRVPVPAAGETAGRRPGARHRTGQQCLALRLRQHPLPDAAELRGTPRPQPAGTAAAVAGPAGATARSGGYLIRSARCQTCPFRRAGQSGQCCQPRQTSRSNLPGWQRSTRYICLTRFRTRRHRQPAGPEALQSQPRLPVLHTLQGGPAGGPHSPWHPLYGLSAWPRA